MTPKEHLDKADQYLARVASLRASYGAPVEEFPQVGVLAALAQAHASTATAMLMSGETA